MATSVTIRRGDNTTLKVTVYQGTASTTVADLTGSNNTKAKEMNIINSKITQSLQKKKVSL